MINYEIKSDKKQYIKCAKCLIQPMQYCECTLNQEKWHFSIVIEASTNSDITVVLIHVNKKNCMTGGKMPEVSRCTVHITMNSYQNSLIASLWFTTSKELRTVKIKYYTLNKKLRKKWHARLQMTKSLLNNFYFYL